MQSLLRDLIAHQEWADAEHWNALASHSSALDDTHIRERLYHIHLTQYAFLTIVSGTPFKMKKLEEFPDMNTLKQYAIGNHEKLASFVESCPANRLEEVIVIPWFKEPPIQITIAQALVQAVMHSHSHRAQNSIRLRELGGQPPLTDFIAWYWKGCPRADWKK